MRLKKTINLGDGRGATVHEMRVEFVRNLLLNLKSELAEMQIEQLLGERFTELVALFDDLIELPEGETVADLTFSDLKAIWDAFKEVNAAFFDLTGLAAGLAGALSSNALNLKTAAASLSNADTSTSDATAGASTSAP